MPLDFLGAVLAEGTDRIPYYEQLKRVAPYVIAGSAMKYWSRGATNPWERKLHGKVYLVTGATTQGMGTSVVLEMARLGAQLIILSRNIDEWTTDWVNDLRDRSENNLIYTEQCDLSNLWQVRKFATGWLDNAPPRRLDGVIVMSGEMEPWGIPRLSPPQRKSSLEGLELQMATNFAGVFHLLDLLVPSFKAQPPDRDVRIIVTTCWLQSMGDVNVQDPLWQNVKYKSALKHFASSKLQLGLCMLELQRRITKAIVEEKAGGVERTGLNVSVTLVQPGTMKSHSLRRVLSNGSVILLILLYCILLYPWLFLLTKSGRRGAQSVLYALMTPELEEINLKTAEVKYISDCSIMKFARKEFTDESLQAQLYANTQRDILSLEKRMAIKRNQLKGQTKAKSTK
ncbi:YNL181W [Zygosaccharomyces parabailii]|uniref:ZYBA0S04-01816g1_1 n=1 Tax=Zygosaccharomyces bailii (strain CLIB 213 / ATCC 58445 / CBS 680 / BCRC 21525 / NBRC 1098 / NCYC 1416 / NRRL Y-2227) TaxID=1333698 RepID=A0A8J2X8A2_ZYGB2|nr:YNL181W [Zygosaccharomyces parabailii]CDF89336.1 ZYBA0S04-01816g1_1 [Zygosaccharomyces bailii CLIB 213]CDH08295.1 uncharacterized protein ZBAI_00077 [Zygosaccharomyces bailii ISA1307]SJM85707.1 uncharacterized protein ZBIST_2413 [Zygosaccharomyces bailii]